MYLNTYGGSALLHLLIGYPRLVLVFGLAGLVGMTSTPLGPGRYSGTGAYLAQLDSAFKPRLADIGWSYGSLRGDLGPASPRGFDESAAALLDEAEDIVNAVGPEILAEFRKQDERRPGLGGWFDKLKRRR